MRKFLLSLAALMAAVCMNATIVNGITYSLNSYDSTAWVSADESGENLYQGDMVIPATVEYEGTPYRVTQIYTYAFSYETRLKSIVLPEGLESIEYGAFDHCDSLLSITLPSTLKSIAPTAFQYCLQLDSIGLPDNLEVIDEEVFLGCENLRAIHLPANLKTIGYEAFHRCYKLANITFPEGLQKIMRDAFWDCYGLTEITLPSTLTVLSDYAFEQCINLRSINLPESITEMGNYLFMGDTLLSEPIYNSKYFAYCPPKYATSYAVPDGIQVILGGAFFDPEGYSTLESVTLPSSVRIIYNDGFNNCTQLSSVTLNEGLTDIGSNAFANTHLTSLALPASLTYVSATAFPASLTTLTVAEGNTKYQVVNNCLIDNTGALVWAPVGATLPEGITEIADYAFEDRDDLTEFTIPSTVTRIGEYAFSSCDNLTSIVVPEGVTEMGYGVFEHCSKLREVTLPSSLTKLSGFMFYYCRSLETVHLPANLKSIGEYAFYACDSLKSLDLPNSVQNIEDYAFSELYNLTSPIYNERLFVRMPTSYEGAYTIPEGIETIESYAFHVCEKLTGITFPSSLKHIEREAFWLYNESPLTVIDLSKGCDTIDSYAFEDVNGVEKLLLPASLSRLDQYAFSFYDFTSLKEIWNYAATPLDMYEQYIYDVNSAWYYIENDVDPADVILYVPEGSVDAYKAAEVWKEFDVQPMPGSHTGIDNVDGQESNVEGRKILRNGQLLIERDGRVYNVLGTQVR